MKRLTDWLVYLVLRIFICVIQTLRLETCQSVSRGLAYLACDLLRIRHAVVDDNIRNVFPQLDDQRRRDMARRMWEHLFLLVCEIAHAPRKIHETNWRNHFRMRNRRTLVRYLLDRRPIVLVSGHFGNFEITSYMAGLLGFPTYAIARRLDNPFLDRYINRFRGAHGQFIVPKDGSARLIDNLLSEGRTIALLGDQAAGRKGCWIELLGRPASCHKAVALFTLVSGAPLVVCYGKRIGGPLQFEMGMEGVADPQVGGPELAGVEPLTRWYNQQLESAILTAPEQYWWVHRRWKDKPVAKRSRKKKTATLPGSGTPADKSAA